MFGKRKNDGKRLCPFAGFKPCIGDECEAFTHLRGTHPQTGQEMDESMCAMRALPILLIENAKETRQGAAAVESFRNEMVKTGAAQIAGVGELVRLANRTQAQRERDERTALVAACSNRHPPGLFGGYPYPEDTCRAVPMPDGSLAAGEPLHDPTTEG